MLWSGMIKEHPADRIARAMRGPILVSAFLCFPAFMLSYGLAMHWLITTAPLWIAIPSIIAHVAVMLGLASLIDTREERRHQKQDVQ